MNLVFITFVLFPLVQSTFGNIANPPIVNQSYRAVLEQFNTSNCSVPFNEFSFEFNCSSKYNTTVCCLDEYNKLNTSFGSMQCNQYEQNDTYLTFNCNKISSSKSNKLNSYLTAGIAVSCMLGVLVVIGGCTSYLRCCRRNKYDSI